MCRRSAGPKDLGCRNLSLRAAFGVDAFDVRDDARFGLQAASNGPMDRAVFRGLPGKRGGRLGDSRHGGLPPWWGGVERQRQANKNDRV